MILSPLQQTRIQDVKLIEQCDPWTRLTLINLLMIDKLMDPVSLLCFPVADAWRIIPKGNRSEVLHLKQPHTYMYM